MRRALAVEVLDSVFVPHTEERVAQVRTEPQGRSLYRVFLYLNGPDLPFVRQVRYQLHPTFQPAAHTVPRTIANPLCRLQLWTWGLFRVEAWILDSQGETHHRVRDLQYDRELALPGIRYERL